MRRISLFLNTFKCQILHFYNNEQNTFLQRVIVEGLSFSIESNTLPCILPLLLENIIPMLVVLSRRGR